MDEKIAQQKPLPSAKSDQKLVSARQRHYISTMKRRSLLKSLGALAATPFMPSIPLAAPTANAALASVVDARTYKWAEMIVRAHNTCSPAMLERLIGLPPAKAAALQAEFLAKGVIGAPSQFGIHKATKPLWDGAFPKPHIRAKDVVETVKDLVTDTLKDAEVPKQPEVAEPNDSALSSDDQPPELNAKESDHQRQA